MLSASSRMTILCLPGGSVTFCCANILILFRTTSMPLNHQVASRQPQLCRSIRAHATQSAWMCYKISVRCYVRERAAALPLVGRVELEDPLLYAASQNLAREREHTSRLADTGRALQSQRVMNSPSAPGIPPQICAARTATGRGLDRKEAPGWALDREDHVRHVPVFSNPLETRNSIVVPNNVVQGLGAVLLHPRHVCRASGREHGPFPMIHSRQIEKKAT